MYTYIHTYIYINNSNICIASVFALPFLIRLFQGWKSLQHPLHGLEVMSLWQRLLQGNEPHEYDIHTKEEFASSTSYTQLFTEVILIATMTLPLNHAKDVEVVPNLETLL